MYFSSKWLNVNSKSASDICGQLTAWCGLFWTDIHESVVPAVPIGDFLFSASMHTDTRLPAIPLVHSIRDCG